MEKLGIIYCYKNKINGKCYIGQTKRPEERKKQHLQKQSYCTAFHHAVEKYGIENFEYTVLHDQKTKKELDFLEKIEIERHNSLVPNGYNILDGVSGVDFDYDSMGYEEKLSYVILSKPIVLSGTGMVFLNAREASIFSGESEKVIKHDAGLDYFERWRISLNRWRYASEEDAITIKKYEIDDIQIEFEEGGFDV